MVVKALAVDAITQRQSGRRSGSRKTPWSHHFFRNGEREIQVGERNWNGASEPEVSGAKSLEVETVLTCARCNGRSRERRVQRKHGTGEMSRGCPGSHLGGTAREKADGNGLDGG